MTLHNQNKILLLKEPFEHIIIENYYSEQELPNVHRELNFIRNSHNIREADTVNTASESGNPIAKRLCVFLHHMFVEPEKSLHLQRLNFKYDRVDEVKNFRILGRQIALTDSTSTLVSFYRDSDYYEPHFDSWPVTQIIYLWPEIKDFHGGELYFPEFNYELKIKNNSCIYFSGAAVHSVRPVVTTNLNNDPIKRVSISTFRRRRTQ